MRAALGAAEAAASGRACRRPPAALVDAVLPPVPVRQWALTLSYRLCYRLARDHALCRAALSVYARAVLAF
jgi:hypothetical protein